MRLSDAPIDVWMHMDPVVVAHPHDRYQARRRGDGWYEFRRSLGQSSVFSMGILSWEDNDFWHPVQ